MNNKLYEMAALTKSKPRNRERSKTRQNESAGKNVSLLYGKKRGGHVFRISLKVAIRALH